MYALYATYGNLYYVNDAGLPGTVTTAWQTWPAIVTPAFTWLATPTPKAEKITFDTAAGTMKVKYSGDYLVMSRGSFLSALTPLHMHTAIAVNGAIQASTEQITNLIDLSSPDGPVTAWADFGIVRLGAGDLIDMRAKSGVNTGGVVLNLNLTVALLYNKPMSATSRWIRRIHQIEEAVQERTKRFGRLIWRSRKLNR